MNRETIAFIVEGEQREPLVVDNLVSNFFKKPEQVKVITLPVGQNIYMLWQQLKEDDYNTDVIDLIRERVPIAASFLQGCSRQDFSEVYLFFDYDAHQQNISGQNDVITDDVIMEMLKYFDNETELGKLYISYPMVEALRDFEVNTCEAASGCFLSKNQFADYKNISTQHRKTDQMNHYHFEDWRNILFAYGMRVSCLFRRKHTLTFDEYRENVSPLTIFHQERALAQDDRTFVLSAFPEFLLDYYPKSFWKTMIKNSQNKRDTNTGLCMKYHC